MEAIQQTIMYFHKGGLVMWPLLFCSIAVIAIAIERFLFYKAEDSGQVFAAKYCELLRADEREEAFQLAEATNGECAKIVADAAKITEGREQQKAFLESQAGIFIAKLKNKLDYLAIIVTMSPLLGLLGTIVGMIGQSGIRRSSRYHRRYRRSTYRYCYRSLRSYSFLVRTLLFCPSYG